jgi:hypothetical protein
MKILKEQCLSPAEQSRAIVAAREAAKALWNFLDGVTAAYLPATA